MYISFLFWVYFILAAIFLLWVSFVLCLFVFKRMKTNLSTLEKTALVSIIEVGVLELLTVIVNIV